MSGNVAEPRGSRPAASRRSIDETRTLLIETAAAMVRNETPVTLGRIDLIDVCRRAGLTSAGSAYKIWSTQEDFRVDLLRHVFGVVVPGRDAIDLVTAAVAADRAALPSLPELIRTATESTGGSEDVGARHFSIYIAQWLAAGDDPVLAAELHASDVELLDAYAELYDQVAHAYDRAWVPPYGPRLFATMVAALTDGLTVRASSQTEIVSRRLVRRNAADGRDAPWSLLACGVLALVETFTRPRVGTGADASENG